MPKAELIHWLFTAWLFLIILGGAAWLTFWPKSFARQFLSHLRRDFTHGTIYRQGQPPEHF